MHKNNKLLKIFKYTFHLFMFFIISFTIFFGYARYIEPYSVKTTHFNLSGNVTKNIKIVLFSDTHFSKWYTDKDFEKVVTLINNESPDLIIFTGDLIDDFNNFDNIKTYNVNDITMLLSSLKSKNGKYAILGNHDYGSGAEKTFKRIMKESDFILLRNNSLYINDLNINISGIDDLIWGNVETDFINSFDLSNYNLLLCHEPYIVDKLNKDNNINLLLSGHTHGGQINIPIITKFIIPSNYNKYIKGDFNLNNNCNGKLYVTSGLGMTKLPLRFMAYPEINIITISPNN